MRSVLNKSASLNNLEFGMLIEFMNPYHQHANGGRSGGDNGTQKEDDRSEEKCECGHLNGSGGRSRYINIYVLIYFIF